MPTGSAVAVAMMVPRHTVLALAGSGTSAPSVSSPHAPASAQLGVTPKANEELTPAAGTNVEYVRLPESGDELHCDSRHMRKTSICAVASSEASTSGYGGSPGPGSTQAFLMHKSMVTVSPTMMLFGSHGVYPGHTVGRNDADAEQTLMLTTIARTHKMRRQRRCRERSARRVSRVGDVGPEVARRSRWHASVLLLGDGRWRKWVSCCLPTSSRTRRPPRSKCERDTE